MSEKTEESKPKVLASFIINLMEGNPNMRFEVDNRGMNPYMMPTLLRQLAKNFEDAILATKSLIGE